ncbi:MAG: iron-sulfur cluster assembly accessory protein [Acidobacteria bacterium]|nr:iron-sulfur cluster assembly accessory protein [Acidobacteriota bacterium]
MDTAEDIQITETAARRIRALMAREGREVAGLRVGVKAGGCSGLSYVYAFETGPRTSDHVFEGPDGVKIFVDPKSYKYLKGTLLDTDSTMLGQSLVFKNPNAKSSCGCGTSFGV